MQIHILDVNSLFNGVIANPSRYGFTNVTDAALLSNSNGSGYLFWDTVHPTTQADQIIAGIGGRRRARAVVAGVARHRDGGRRRSGVAFAASIQRSGGAMKVGRTSRAECVLPSIVAQTRSLSSPRYNRIRRMMREPIWRPRGRLEPGGDACER